MAAPIRLGLIIPDINDPTSFYRSIGPLSVLQKQMGKNLEFQFPNPVNRASLQLCDIIFLQRPCTPEHFTVLMWARDLGRPIWVDFDDDNLSVPRSNQAYPMYCQPQIKDSIVKLTRYADVVTVSTEKIRKKYSIYNNNVFVIPNALDDFLVRLRVLPTTPRNRLLLWRGTPTHNVNLRVIEHEVKKLAHNHKDWKFGFLGHDPINITEGTFEEFAPKDFDTLPSDPAEIARLANEKLREWREKEPTRLKNMEVFNNGAPLDLMDYFKSLPQLHATACYYSLAKNDHSQSRSHVSWLEATFGGMLFVGPDMEEFRRPGALNFKTPSEFYSIMESIMKGEIDIDKHVNESWEHIMDKYLLSKINGARATILKQLHERVYGPLELAPAVIP